MLYSNKINLIGLQYGDGVSTDGLLSLNKVVSVARGYVTLETDIEFTAGTEEDVPPIINLALTQHPFTERIDMYFDIGATDASKDLDVLTTTTMYPLYIDPAYIKNEGMATAGTLPPNVVMLRCLVGSGLVYLNVNPDLNAVAKYAPPLSLSAEAGVFYYTFPRRKTHFSRANVTSRVPIALLSIFLRTFESPNRFQITLFK